jgi:hypothetical protein
MLECFFWKNNLKATSEYRRKLYLKAWAFNRKKHRSSVRIIIKGIEKRLCEQAKRGKYYSLFTTDENRLDSHYENIIAFRWLLRYSRYKPTLKDEKILVTSTGKRYIDQMCIEFNWDLSSDKFN